MFYICHCEWSLGVYKGLMASKHLKQRDRLHKLDLARFHRLICQFISFQDDKMKLPQYDNNDLIIVRKCYIKTKAIVSCYC